MAFEPSAIMSKNSKKNCKTLLSTERFDWSNNLPNKGFENGFKNYSKHFTLTIESITFFILANKIEADLD